MLFHLQTSLNGHVNWVKTAKFSSDGRLVASGSDDKSLKLWDISSKECIHTFFEHTGFINDVSYYRYFEREREREICVSKYNVPRKM